MGVRMAFHAEFIIYVGYFVICAVLNCAGYHIRNYQLSSSTGCSENGPSVLEYDSDGSIKAINIIFQSWQLSE